MLRNRLYLGEIVHGKLTYPGQHAGIINSALFDEVQALLAMNKGQRTRRSAERALLTGLVHDAAGNRMTPAHSRGCGGKTYTYYVSQPPQQGGIAPEHILTRVPARQLEQALVAAPLLAGRAGRICNGPARKGDEGGGAVGGDACAPCQRD